MITSAIGALLDDAVDDLLSGLQKPCQFLTGFAGRFGGDDAVVNLAIGADIG